MVNSKFKNLHKNQTMIEIILKYWKKCIKNDFEINEMNQKLLLTL